MKPTMNQFLSVLSGYRVHVTDTSGWAASHRAASWADAMNWVGCYPTWADVAVTRYGRLLCVRKAAGGMSA